MRENIILHLKNISFYLKANKKKKIQTPKATTKVMRHKYLLLPPLFPLGKDKSHH